MNNTSTISRRFFCSSKEKDESCQTPNITAQEPLKFPVFGHLWQGFEHGVLILHNASIVMIVKQ